MIYNYHRGSLCLLLIPHSTKKLQSLENLKKDVYFKPEKSRSDSGKDCWTYSLLQSVQRENIKYQKRQKHKALGIHTDYKRQLPPKNPSFPT